MPPGPVSRFISFVTIGGIATAIQFVILITLVRWAGAGPVVASAVGFVVSALFNYLANYRFTFRSEQSHGSAGIKFMLLAGAGLGLSTGLMQLLTGLRVHYLVAQVFATALVLMWNFIGNSLWTFRHDQRRSPE